MASSSAQSAATILVTCKQTRFHIESPVYQELDIAGLGITIKSAESGTPAKSKGKAKGEGLEILTNATLKLKPSIHYALVGRNGTGKSTILRAIAEKLIPGIPLQTRISILQQTGDNTLAGISGVTPRNPKSVLEYVLDIATSANDIQPTIDILSKSLDSADKFAPVRALRRIRHQKLEKQLFELDKDARLRSGTRGMQARKALTAFEETVRESAERIDEADVTESAVKEETQEAIEMLGELQSFFEPAKMAELEKQARVILSGLGFSTETMNKSVTSLSGGWRMRTTLASVLLKDSDILILDEPTNFLDLFGILWLQKYLIGMQETNNTTILLVSHDRDFVNAVCQEVIILKDLSLTYFRGNISAYEEDLRSKKLHLGRMKDAQDKQRTHMEKTIAQNIKAGKAAGDDNKLRQAKSRQKKLDDRMGLNVSASGGRFKLNRDLVGYHLTSRAAIDIPADEKGITIILPPAPDLRFPGPLVSLENVSLKYKSAEKATLEDINFVIHAGDRVGVVGLNGSGKSTLIKLLVDTYKPSKGTVARHPRLRLGYYSQHTVEDLQKAGTADPALTALSMLMKDAGDSLDEPECRGLLGSLGLPGRTASDVPVAKLSGGQLVRLALAIIFWKEPQLLVLDEITTHLDFHTVKALMEALSGWNGGILLVSHDRYLIRAVVEGDVEDDAEGESEEEEGRRREVFVLRNGKLKVLSSGVAGFEDSLSKKLEALSV